MLEKFIKMKCEKCSSKKFVRKHYIRRKEICGIDEITILCPVCKQKLYSKLKRKKKFNNYVGMI